MNYLTVTASVLVSLAVVCAGCGSSSDTGAGADTGAGTDGGSSGTGPKDPATVCAYIASADLQALLTATTTISKTSPVLAGLFYECNYQVKASSGSTNSDMHVDFYPSDSTEASYDNLKKKFPSDTFHDFSGVGDKAYWFQGTEGQSPPTVVAHKGATSCVVMVPSDPPMIALTYTGNNVSSADAQAYAVKMGKLCTDLFTGYGS